VRKMAYSKQIFEAKWICPICGNIGKKWLLVRNVRKNGRNHLKIFHNEYEVDPIIKKRRVKYD